MVLHVKKPRKKLFSLARPAFYVVADSRKNVLEVFSNESKSELIYLLSLTDALLSFESDDANMVMEKCFCVEAKTWKKRNTVTFRHQAFVFFEESQVRMLLWVKCIHVAIKRASNVAADRDLFRSSGAASNTSDSPPFTDDDEQQHFGDHGDESEATCSDRHEASSSSHYAGPSAVRKRLVIDPHAAIAPQKEPKTPFNRLNAMFLTHKQQLKSPKSSETTASSASSGSSNHKESRTTAAAAVCALLSPRMLSASSVASSSSLAASSAAATKNPFHCKSASSKNIGANSSSTNGRSHTVHSESSAVRKRVERSSGSSSSATAAAASSSLSTTDAYYEDVRSSRLREYAVPPKIHRYNYQIGTRADTHRGIGHDYDDAMGDSVSLDAGAPGQTLDTKVAFVLSRCMVLWVAFLGGVVEASIFLPIAAAGVFAHVCRLNDEFFSSTLAMLSVYLVSRFQGSLGVVAIFVTLYLWCYAEFKTQRRIRRVRVADRLLQEENESFAHVDVSACLLDVAATASGHEFVCELMLVCCRVA